MLDVTVIVLTLNEELHVKRCLDRITPRVKRVCVIDCFSKDRTVKIASGYDNVDVFEYEWPGSQALQFNWALDNVGIDTGWVLRLDADEYLTPELVGELEDRLPGLGQDVTGVVLPLRRVFLGRTIRRGMPAVKLLRLFRNGKGRSEVRLMDEHIELSEGVTVEMRHEFADDNLNNLSWWTQKHVGYAIREATDLLDMEFDLTGAASADEGKQISGQAHAKRMKKHRYAKQPLFWRSFAYFCYRYFFKMGFLEGKEGFLWHFLQGWWYRTLVDAKVMEIKRACGDDRERIRKHLKEKYGVMLPDNNPGG